MPASLPKTLSLATLALAASVTAQGWVLRTPTHAPPAQGYQPSLAYHLTTQRVVLHGGRASTILGDTWTYDGTDWRMENPISSPGQRWGHRMVYDSALDFVVMFGGQATVSTALNETWIWNGQNWAQIVTRNAPSPRAWHEMAYDARRDRVVVFGGFAVRDQRTWEFDGADWRGVTTAHVPPIVGSGEMVYDPSRGVCVLFGGWDDYAAVYAGTWEYDGRDWRSIATASTPTLRTRHQMSFDVRRNQVVLHGGTGRSGELHDTWTYDGTNWRLWPRSGTPPVLSVEGGMTYDIARDVHVYFGGRGIGVTSADTNEYTSVRYPSFAPMGAGCAGSAGVPALSAASGSVPQSGTTMTARVTNVPASTSFVVVTFGVSNATFGSLRLPLDMAAIGMPGCRLEGSVDVAFPAPAAGGIATWSLAIPPALTAGTFWQQVFVPDAAAGNPGRATLSNACRGTIAP